MAHTTLPRHPGIINDWIYANPEIFLFGVIAIGIGAMFFRNKS